MTAQTLRIGFASFEDGTFELNLEDPYSFESAQLTGKISKGEAMFVDRFFPTCVYVTVEIK